MPARPRKSSRDSVTAAFQGLWKITTHIWHQASPLTTLHQHQRMWPYSAVCWVQEASTVSTKCPSSSGTAFPRVAGAPPEPHSVPGDLSFPPEHRQVWSCRVAALALPLFPVLMEFEPSPFSFLPSPFFNLVPVAVSNFPLSLQLLLVRGAFPVFSPLPWDPSSLCLQKWLPACHGFYLPKFTSLCCVPAE